MVDVLTEIGKADGTLESMVAQNAMYQFSRDPYEAKVTPGIWSDICRTFAMFMFRMMISCGDMVAQNAMYQFSRDPYEAKAILVNGVHNMPLPVLCCLLEYAFMHKCSLFMTGSPRTVP